MDEPAVCSDVKKHVLFLIFFSQMTACSGRRVICPSPLIEAEEGEDVSLPCYTEPRGNLSAYTVDWRRGLVVVYSFRHKQEDHRLQVEPYRRRATVPREDLNRGNATLLLQSARPSDSGRFKCNVPKWKSSCWVELNVSKAQQKTAERHDGCNSTVECPDGGAEPGGPDAGRRSHVPAIFLSSFFGSVVAALICSAVCWSYMKTRKRRETPGGHGGRCDEERNVDLESPAENCVGSPD